MRLMNESQTKLDKFHEVVMLPKNMGTRFFVMLIIFTFLITPISPTYLESELENNNINARSLIECEIYTTNSPLANGELYIELTETLLSQTCAAIFLQSNKVLDIDFDILDDDQEDPPSMDLLFMDKGVYNSYLNEQVYHINPLSDSYLFEKNPSMENLTESIEFSWTSPTYDGNDQFPFVIILDNLRHPKDEGRGSGGNNAVTISLSINQSSPKLSEPHDSIIQLENNLEYEIINTKSYPGLSDEPLIFDVGDSIKIESKSLFGNGEMCLIKNPIELFNCDSEEIKLEFSELETKVLEWTVTPEIANVSLNLLIINKENNKMASTITIIVTPVLNPIIEILSHNSSEIQLEDILELDASSSPNKWNQISQFKWDIEEIGVFEGAEMDKVDAKWDSPGEYLVNLELYSIVDYGIDPGNQTKSILINVIDSISPNLKITGISNNDLILQNEIITIKCDCTDNHEISEIKWTVNNENDSGLNFTLDTTKLGPQNLTIAVTDVSGNIAETNLFYTIIDATAPELISINWPENNLVQNTELEFKIKANDQEDSNLIYRWDIDLSVDSNNDGNKRNDWIIGTVDPLTNEAKIEYSYSSPGIYSVMVQVINSENRKIEYTNFVTVSEMSSTNNNSILYFSGGIILLLLISIGGFIAWKNIQQRISEIEAKNKNLTPEEQAQLQQQQLSQQLYGNNENNLENIANIGSNTQQWERSQFSSNQNQITNNSQINNLQTNNNIGNDMLNALIEEDEKLSKPKKTDDDLSFLTDMKNNNVQNSNSSEEKQNKSSGIKIELPGKPIENKNKRGLKIELPTSLKTKKQEDRQTNENELDI